MNFKKGPLSVFTEPGYWVVGLYGRDKGDKYWDVYTQYDEHYFNFGFSNRLTGDFVLTRQGTLWLYQDFQEYANQRRERSRWVWGRRWSADWRSAAEIHQIEADNKERDKRVLELQNDQAHRR